MRTGPIWVQNRRHQITCKHFSDYSTSIWKQTTTAPCVRGLLHVQIKTQLGEQPAILDSHFQRSNSFTDQKARRKRCTKIWNLSTLQCHQQSEELRPVGILKSGGYANHNRFAVALGHCAILLYVSFCASFLCDHLFSASFFLCVNLFHCAILFYASPRVTKAYQATPKVLFYARIWATAKKAALIIPHPDVD